MKKKILFIFLTFCLLLGFIYLQYGRQPTLNHSTINQTGDSYDLSLSITLNKIFLLNKNSVKKELLQQIEDNAVPGILFSYDMHGKPKSITCTVYMNSWMQKLDMPALHFNYIRNTE